MKRHYLLKKHPIWTITLGKGKTGASLPTTAAKASLKSPVEIPLRYSQGATAECVNENETQSS